MRINGLKIEYIVILILVFLLLKSCPSNTSGVKKTRVVKTDTILLKKIDSMGKLFREYSQKKPEVVYVKVKENTLKRLSNEEAEEAKAIGSNELVKLNEYKDTIQNKDLIIYSNILTDGKIYENNIKYELNYPVVKKTIVETIKKNNSGLFFYSSLEGNQEQLRGVSLGLQYVHRNKWFIGYGINTIVKPGVNHQVQIGVKIF